MTFVGAAILISSKPSWELTTKALSLPKRARTVANGFCQSVENTPTTCFLLEQD